MHKSKYENTEKKKTEGKPYLVAVSDTGNNCHLFLSNLVPMALPRSKWRLVGDANKQQIASSSNIYIIQLYLYHVIRRSFVCRARTGEEVGVIQCLMTNVINSMGIKHM